MIIDIVSDVICPWCFIGKRRLEKALALAPQSDLQIAWRPFQLNPDMPVEGMARADYLRAKFGDQGGGPRYDQVRAAGAEENIAFAFERMTRTPNTLLAHRLIRWAEAHGAQDATVERLFRAYFLEGEDVGDLATLIRLAGDAGLEPDAAAAYLASDENAEQIRREDAFARQAGINGVPCFIIDRKFAISGAQPPEAFLEVFQVAARDKDTAVADA
jgi:predicted DsbA family dithiol-disulfide isomerase